MGSDGVVVGGEGGDVVGEVDAAGDVVAVEVFVFQRPEPAFDDAVGPRGAVAGAHVGEVAPRGEPARHRDGFHGGAVVGDDHERQHFAGRLVDAVLDEWAAQQRFGGLDSRLEGGDEVGGALGGRDGAHQGQFGGVVDDAAERPGAFAGGLER